MRCELRIRFIGLLFLMLIITIDSVSASWVYPSEFYIAQEGYMNVNLMEYQWSGSEILPDDVEGEDHASLIAALISDTVGLSNPNSELTSNLSNRVNHWLSWRRKDYYGSMDGTWFDESLDMEGVFNTDTLGLSFIIQEVSDTKCYIFTTDVYLGPNGEPSVSIGEWIYPIYRTEIVRNDANSPFDIVETKRGKAKSMYYEQILLPPHDAPSFDIDSWVETTLGTAPNINESINTFVGDNGVAYPENETTPIYYRIKTTTSSNIRVSSTRLDITIKILNTDGSVIVEGAIATMNDENLMVCDFTAAANTDYYIEYTGAKSIPFDIQAN